MSQSTKDSLYREWLSLRSKAGTDESDAEADRRLSQIIELTRQICMVPADDHDDLLRKFELVEVEITDEVIAGPAADCSLAAMIGGIKADVMQLMDGRYPHQKKQQAAQ